MNRDDLDQILADEYGRPHRQEAGSFDFEGKKFIIAQHAGNGSWSVYSQDGRHDWFGGKHEKIVAFYGQTEPPLLCAIDETQKEQSIRINPYKKFFYSSDGRNHWFGGPHDQCSEVLGNGKDAVILGGNRGLNRGCMTALDGKPKKVFGSFHNADLMEAVIIDGQTFLRVRSHDPDEDIDYTLFVAKGGTSNINPHYNEDNIIFDQSSARESRYGSRQEYDATYFAIRDWLASEKTDCISFAVENIENIAGHDLLRRSPEIFGMNLEELLDSMGDMLSAENFSFWMKLVEKFYSFDESRFYEAYAIGAYTGDERPILNLDYLKGLVEQTKGHKGQQDDVMRILSNMVLNENSIARNIRLRTLESAESIMRCANVNIDNYLVIGMLPEGGSSEVYLAIDRRVARDCEDAELVAIKIMKDYGRLGKNLKAKINAGSSGTYEIALNELRLLRRLIHTNLAGLIGEGMMNDGMIFLVQPYYEGGSLEDNIQADAYRAIQDILEGLSYLHKKGFVHRDLKPSNVFLSEDNGYLIGDMQTCRKVDLIRISYDANGNQPGYGLTHGSSHGAPETFIAESYGKAVDIYSMGIIMWRMMTGRPVPFSYSRDVLEGNSDDRNRMLHRKNVDELLNVLRDERCVTPIIEKKDAGFCRFETGAMINIIERCLEFDPSARYADASELRKGLKKAFRTKAF